MIEMAVYLEEEVEVTDDILWRALEMVHKQIMLSDHVDNPPRTGQEKRTI